MIGLLIITHQTLGAAYYQLIQHFFPNLDQSHIAIINVENSDDHIIILQKARSLISTIDQGYGILILTDIFGATPCNAALKLVEHQQLAVITGLNAPMLIKAISHTQHYCDLMQFTQLIEQAGKNGITSFTQPFQAA